MSAVATSVDQTADFLQNLSVETKNKAGDAPVASMKTSGTQYGAVNVGQAPKIQIPSFERSSTPLIPGFMDPNVYFMPNGYPSTPFYFGGYDGYGGEWDDYASYLNTEGVEMPHGVYGDMYHHGYGYAPYSSYSCSGSQHYQYPSPYFPLQTSLISPYSSNYSPLFQGEVASPEASDQRSATVGYNISNSNVFPDGMNNWNSAYLPQKHNQQSSSFPSNGSSYGRGGLSYGAPFSGYQDPSLSFDGMRSPFPWYYGPASTYPNLYSATPNTVSSTASQNNSSISTRNQNGSNSPRTTSAMGRTGTSTINRMYPTNLMYGQYGNAFRESVGLGSQFYDSRMNFYGFNGYGYENFDGLSELNRGPRANRFKFFKDSVPTVTAGSNSSTDEATDEVSIIVPNREQYNRADFPENYKKAKFFIIKSYSEDDIHRSIKYSVWTSTTGGNKKLDAAYKEAMDEADGCPVFLFYSVNTSGQFVGVAEMVAPIDFNKTVDYWQQDKWTGCFDVKWHIVKDVPNSILRHITLEYNENKPVTNSRDTQEVKLEQGLQMLKIFKDHVSKTSILDDFEFYEAREKLMLERRARQQQHNKQVISVKLTDPQAEKDKETGDS